jgi:hypothetical protein
MRALLFLLAGLAIMYLLLAKANDGIRATRGNSGAAATWRGDPYLPDTDPVTNSVLPGEPLKFMFKGRELRFAEKGNLEVFLKNSRKYLNRVDRLMISQQLPFYPLETCIVSDEPLERSMEPVDRIVRNRLVRFCCPGCITTRFAKDENRYLSALDKAVITSRLADYPTNMCIVSGKELGVQGSPVNVVIGNRLVRLCCNSCEELLRSNPGRYLRHL